MNVLSDAGYDFTWHINPGNRARKDIGESVGRWLLQLCAVHEHGSRSGPPTVELRGMAEPVTFHVVIAHLNDTLGSQTGRTRDPYRRSSATPRS